MKSECVVLYGETCAGKSTVGKHLSLIMQCPFIAFGDRKRDEIARRTEIGIAIENILQIGSPIPAELGYALIEKAIRPGLNIISGYPISIDEFTVLSAHCAVAGVIVLSINESALLKRFELRRICPQCQEPGVDGDFCPIHKIQMVRRVDANAQELVLRRKLYVERITPFLESSLITRLRRLNLDTSTLTREEVKTRTREWIEYLLFRGGGRV